MSDPVSMLFIASVFHEFPDGLPRHRAVLYLVKDDGRLSWYELFLIVELQPEKPTVKVEQIPELLWRFREINRYVDSYSHLANSSASVDLPTRRAPFICRKSHNFINRPIIRMSVCLSSSFPTCARIYPATQKMPAPPTPKLVQLPNKQAMEKYLLLHLTPPS